MKKNATEIETLFGIAQDYTKTSLELFKLQTIEKFAAVFSSLASRVVVFITVTLFTLFLNIAIALWIGEILGKIYFGFFVMAVFYSIIATIVYVYRKTWIEKPVRNTIIDKMMDKSEA